MKSLRQFAFLAIGMAACLLATSCQSSRSPQSVASKLDFATVTEVYGYNGSMAPRSRSFVDCGPLPATARRAMVQYIKGASWKPADYIHPHQFVRVDNAGWIICTNARGELVGILAPERANIEAVKRYPTCGSYKILVNESEDAPYLAYAILKGLEPSDAYRQSVRSNLGLEPTVLTAPAPKEVAPVAKPVVTQPTASTTTETATPAKKDKDADSDDEDSDSDDDSDDDDDSASSDDDSSSSDDSDDSDDDDDDDDF